MELFGFQLGKKKEGQAAGANQKKLGLNIDLRQETQKLLALLKRFQVTVIALAIIILLAVTALRMLHYMDPAPDEIEMQNNIAKFKPVHIDQKTVKNIKQLNDSNVAPAPVLENGRTNPFSE